MILAAGLGTRMRPLTEHIPKPLLKAGGKPLIEYHLAALARSGFTHVVINLAWQGERLRAALGDGTRFGLAIHYCAEPEGALETGGGIRQALPWLGPEPFLVVNGDIWTDCPLRPRGLAHDVLAHLVLVDNPAHHPKGDFYLADGRITEDYGTRLTFSGIGYYRPELFADLSALRFALAPLLYQAAAQGRISAEHYPGQWFDIGTPARLEALDAYLSGLS